MGLKYIEPKEATGWHLWELREGDKIRVVPSTPIRTVFRVTPGAAYYAIEVESTYEVEDKDIKSPTFGKKIQITRKAVNTSYISRHSFVEMLERGPVSKPKEKLQVAAKPSKAPRELPPVNYIKTRRVSKWTQ